VPVNRLVLDAKVGLDTDAVIVLAEAVGDLPLTRRTCFRRPLNYLRLGHFRDPLDDACCSLIAVVHVGVAFEHKIWTDDHAVIGDAERWGRSTSWLKRTRGARWGERVMVSDAWVLGVVDCTSPTYSCTGPAASLPERPLVTVTGDQRALSIELCSRNCTMMSLSWRLNAVVS
jgi:hypothetical protein